MRFLCLHGGGTSAKPCFLRCQARIRQALGRDHDFVFANGTVPSEPDAGAAAITDEFFRFTDDSESASQHRRLYDDMLELVRTRGPFDGLMGFSEGGAVAALLLVEDSRRRFAGFRCAVLFSAALPFDPDDIVHIDSSKTGDGRVVRWLDPKADGVLLSIPTAHMWSEVDDVNAERARSLAQLCDEGLREVFVHRLGHDVPGSKSDEGLKGAMRAIEHTIENAMTP